MFRTSLPTLKVCLFMLLAAAMVTLSGCGKVKVPDLSGMTRAQAEGALTGAKLAVGTVSEEYHATVAADRVIRQTPEAGLKVKTKTTVGFVVSKGSEPPAQAAVPYVVGMARAAAEAVITAAGLTVGTVTEVYDATVPPGQVTAQNPAAGVMTAPGSAVNLTVSKGPEPPVQIAVPNVVGMTQAMATTALTDEGLTVGAVTEAFSATVPAGQVISQNPAAATLAIPGFAVNLTVSKGPEPVQIAVPNVVGMTQAAAATALTGTGLTVGAVTEAFSATVPAGQVISQNPAAAALVAPGSVVALVVSKGVEPVAVPNVVGMTQAAATTSLTGAGLSIGAVTEAFSATVPAGQVISQNPVAAALVAPGFAVALIVSKGVEPVAVPNVVGMTQAAAATALTGAGLSIGAVTEAFSATVPAGQVISQNPVAAALVAPGSAVALIVSKGPQPIAVPNVVGMTQTAATTALTGAGFTVGTVTQSFSATVPAGQVISQTPAAGIPAVPGSAVDLDVSKGPVPAGDKEVPNVVGMTQAAAETALTAAELTLGAVVEAFSATVPAGRVISQNPAAALMVATGTPVNLTVSKGPEPVAVPNIVSMTQAAATTALTGAGFTVGTVTEAYSATVPAGQVISQNPAAATLAVPGTAVNLTVSKGPEPVAVPNVVGMTQAAATTALTGVGFTVGAVTESFSATVPAGQVISQDPAAAALAVPGSAVALEVSKGPAPVGDKEVPDVVGMTQAAAETALTAAELTLGSVTEAYSETVPAGQVISQNPAAGTMVAAATPVNLVISLGSEPVNVPDAGLAAAIRDQLGLAGGAVLTRAHLAALNTLNAYNRAITDLTGLEHAVNLSELNLESNAVADLTPLSGLTSLETLSLSTNLITDLGPLSGLTGLLYLALGDNQISNLAPLSGLTGLPQLSVNDNQIADLTPLSGLTGLEGLHLSENQIADLGPLSGLTALESLSFSNNQVDDLTPLAGLSALTALSAGNNLITTTAGLGGLTALQTLYLNNNLLTDASALATLSGLISLYLGDNQLTALPDLSALAGLAYLDAQSNQFTDTAPFAALTALNTLNLRYNDISDLTGLSGLSTVTTLDLGYNRIADVTPLAGLTALQWLNLRGNRITDATALAGLANLYSLNLRLNNLITVAPLVGGAVFTTPPDTPMLNLQANPLLAEVCDTQIPALETRGVTVTYDACAGPVYVPDLSGMTRAEAEAALDAVGLYRDEVTEVFSETVPAGYLTDQDPPAGLPVTAGSVVDITVSVGPEGGQLVNVPDANLAAAIRAELGLDPGTPLTTAHLAALTGLYVNNGGIADLTGLEYAVNMLHLSLFNNTVSSAAPLAGLHSLQSLTLSMNPVTDLTPLAGLTSLTTLYLYRCGATDITPLAGLVNLYELNLNENNLSDVTALAGMTELDYLYLNANELTSLAPLSGLASLVHLEAHHNRLADLTPLSVLTGMTHLNLANNRILDASPLAGLTHLNELNLRYNLLTTMTAFPAGAVFTAADGTPYLYLEQNPLLPEVCDTQIPALETRGVEVYHDACTGPVFVPDVTGGSRSEAEIALEDAGLDAGNVAEVFSETVPAGFVISQDPAAGTPVTPGYEVDLVVSLGPEIAQLVNVPDPNLAAAIRDQLGLPGDTPLTTAHLASLYWLDAVYEGITDLTGLEYAVNLRWLNLGANPVADLTPLAGAVSLESLGLYECAITDITPLAGLANLVDVNLRDNAITDITPLAGMSSMIALYLNDNGLADIGPLSGLTGLIVLYLTNNHVQDVSPLASLAALNELSLGGNHITSVAALASGTVFSASSTPEPYLELYADPLLPAACDTEIPALEARGVTVNHDACTGPIYVPDLAGTTRAGAEAELTDMGLSMGTVTKAFSATVPAGHVAGQFPAAGTPVTASYPVNLTVSDGPEGGQLVNVPDAGLADAIRAELSLVSGTPLTTAHLAALDDLDANAYHVADLTGLEYAVNLRVFYASDGTVADLSPLAGLSSLTTLTLGNNQITDISPLSGLTALQYLFLDANRIQDPSPLAGMENLRQVNFYGNHIISVASFTAGVIFSASPETPYLYLGQNPLLPEACDTQIPALEARGVAVYHDACAGPVYVPDVTGDAQSVATSEITAAGLNLGTVAQAFSDTVPAGFVISQDPAAGVPAIPASNVNLVVSTGPEVAVLVNVPDANLAAAIRTQLGLDPGTLLTTAHLAALTYLNAGWIGVADLTGLEYGVNLTTLYLGGNVLTDLAPLAGLTGLDFLALDSNALTDISPLAGLVRLNTLYLGTNHIVDADPLAGLTALTYLDLYDNLVADTTPFAGLVNLVQLQLSRNQVADVSPLAGLDVLVNLVLSENFITTIEPLVSGTVFTNATNQECYLYGNPLVPEVCTTQIPALEARGVDVYHDDCNGGVPVPDLAGMTRAAAEQALIQAGVHMGTVTEVFSGTVSAGFVVSQALPPGTVVLAGAAIAVTVSTGPEGGQLVNVPDAALAAAIRTELGLDPATALTTAHLAALDRLNVSMSAVADLTGLEYAVNTQYLYLDHNVLTTLAPLAGLSSLRELWAGYNQITDLATVSSMSGLVSLYLDSNQIVDISPLAGLTGLTQLNLNYNRLTDVSPLAGMEVMVNLSLQGNHLTTLAPLVSGTTFIQTDSPPPDLYANNNPLGTDVCDTQVPALEARGVTVYNDPCTGSVTAPDVVGMTRLAAQTAVDALGLSLGVTEAHSAVVPAGYIISQSPSGGLPVVTGSQINVTVSIGPEGGTAVNVPDAALADAIRNALGLAAGTPLTTAHLAALGTLNAGSAGVTDLTGLEYGVNLSTLHVNYSALTGLGPLAGLSGLRYFSCYGCGISDISDLAGMVSLQQLYLGDNNVSDLAPLAGLTELQFLYAGINNVSDATPLAGLTTLVSLELSYNALTDVAWAAGLTGLTNLYLSDNTLGDLSALAGLTVLEVLALDNNLITDASPLANLSALETLGLSYNHVTTLAPLVAGTIFQDAVSPGDVYLSGNPFETDVCDTQIPALEARGVTTYHEVCTGAVLTPDVVGLTQIGATREVGLLGLSVGTVTEAFSDTVAAGYVISQNPLAGLPLVPGASVDLTVSTGPEVGVPVSVPDGGLADAIISQLSLAPATPLTTAHLAQLTYLSVSNVGVTTLTGLEYAVNLTNFYATNNVLTSVAPLGGLVNLFSVYVNNNLLTDASPFAGMPVIAFLDLSYNQLTDATPLAGLATLEQLGLGYNQLTTLEPLVSGTVFSSAANTPELYVYGNLFIADVCAVQIPALETAGVTVHDSCP